MSFRRLLLAALVALLGPTAHGAELWAGSSCTLTTIQAAVDAAAASGESANTIHLLADETYSERVHVDGLNLTLRGASAGCGSVFYVQGATSTIDGTGGSDASLLAITGSGTVVLRDLTFQNGHAFVGGGGGITVAGSGSVSLDNVGVILNSASDGGGIIASGQGGSLDVYINEDTLIANNTAQGSGGGIQIGGSATLHITDPDTWIALNHAPNGYGGGIDVLAPARALIGSPGFHGTPAVYSNNAAYGGGIAVRGTGSDSADLGAKVVLFTSDPANPVQVSSNTASVSGGGVYLVPLLDLSVGSAATLDAYDFIIDDNLAPEGSALALDTWTALGFADDGSKVDLNTGARPAGAVACAANVACSEISRNIAQDAQGQPTLGATILVNTSSSIFSGGLAMHGNVANFLFHAIGDNDGTGGIQLHNCVTGGNQIARELIKLDGDDNPVVLDQCTLAPDIINSQYVIRFDNTSGNILTITNTIIDEPGTLAFYNPGIDLFVDYVLTNDDTTLPDQVDVILGEPTFVDPANGDYRQTATSLGVDFAPAAGGVDLDGNPRDVDLPIGNIFGPRDLGAYEAQHVLSCAVGDTIFCDGFDGT